MKTFNVPYNVLRNPQFVQLCSFIWVLKNSHCNISDMFTLICGSYDSGDTTHTINYIYAQTHFSYNTIYTHKAHYSHHIHYTLTTKHYTDINYFSLPTPQYLLAAVERTSGCRDQTPHLV